MKPKFPLKRTVLAATTASMAIFSTAALGDAEFDGSKARVNLSSKLKMLGEEVASASCRINAGIDLGTAKEELASARNDFNVILSGLSDGSEALGIPAAEKNSNVIKALAEVTSSWSEIDSASETLLSGQGNTDAAAQVVAEADDALFEATDKLIAQMTGRYANPNELTYADAMAINIAGRQRSIGHQIAKEICGIATNQTASGSVEGLGQQIDMYNVSLTALREGMVSAGVNPPPNDAIRAELDGINSMWQQNLPALQAIRSGTMPSPNNVAQVAAVSNRLMQDMSNIVTLYMLATPGQEDVYRVPLQSYAERELTKWLKDPSLIKAIKAQNEAHASLSQADIDQLDLDWRAQRKADAKPLIEDLLGRPASAFLRNQQAQTANFVTEVFAMDNKGLNVAQSVETSDYWQGDEGKWQKTYGNGSGDMHISEVEFDESTGTYQSQVSMVIRDPDTNEMIGAITFGVNVQSLL